MEEKHYILIITLLTTCHSSVKSQYMCLSLVSLPARLDRHILNEHETCVMFDEWNSLSCSIFFRFRFFFFPFSPSKPNVPSNVPPRSLRRRVLPRASNLQPTKDVAGGGRNETE